VAIYGSLTDYSPEITSAAKYSTDISLTMYEIAAEFLLTANRKLLNGSIFGKTLVLGHHSLEA